MFIFHTMGIFRTYAGFAAFVFVAEFVHALGVFSTEPYSRATTLIRSTVYLVLFVALWHLGCQLENDNNKAREAIEKLQTLLEHFKDVSGKYIELTDESIAYLGNKLRTYESDKPVKTARSRSRKARS